MGILDLPKSVWMLDGGGVVDDWPVSDILFPDWSGAIYLGQVAAFGGRYIDTNRILGNIRREFDGPLEIALTTFFVWLPRTKHEKTSPIIPISAAAVTESA